MRRSPMPPRKKPLRADTPLERHGELPRGRAVFRAQPDTTDGPPPARTPKRRAPIRAKYRADAREHEAWRELILGRVGGYCEARLEGCTGTATDVHHRWLPGRVDTPENGVALCSSCHTGSPAAVHRNPAWSYRVGLLVRRGEGPPERRWSRSLLPPPP